MAIRQLEGHAVEKVWGRRDLPAMFGHADDRAEPVGEIWFADDAAPDLLVKYLFTSEKLSIQVHPDDALARASGHRCGKGRRCPCPRSVIDPIPCRHRWLPSAVEAGKGALR